MRNLWTVTITYPDNAAPTVKNFENFTKLGVYLSKIPLQIELELHKTVNIKIDRNF